MCRIKPNRVEGVLYEIEAEDLVKLDVYEGYPDQYTRREMVVACDGRQETAVVYIAQPDKVKGGLQPSTEYLDRIQNGSDLLSDAYRDKLSNWESID